MNTVKFDKKDVLVVAHRGLSGIEAENTNAAFVAAGNRSYYGIETDVHRTIDGEIVVSHDSHLKRTAGVDIDAESSTLLEFQSIPLYDIDGVADRIDLRAPTLKNYIKICKKYEKRSVLELKSDFTDSEIERIIEIIDSYEYFDSVTFISFIYENLKKVRKVRPDASLQFLFSEITDGVIENVVRDKMDVDVYHAALTREAVELFHSKGIKVNCWTVNNKERGEELASFGVDFITTNILE